MPAPTDSEYNDYRGLIQQALDGLLARHWGLEEWPRLEAILWGAAPPPPKALEVVRGALDQLRAAISYVSRKEQITEPAALAVRWRNMDWKGGSPPPHAPFLLRWLDGLTIAAAAPPDLPARATQEGVGATPPGTGSVGRADPLPAPLGDKRERPAGYVNTSFVIQDPALRTWFTEQLETGQSKAAILLEVLAAYHAGLPTQATLEQQATAYASEIAAIRADYEAQIAALEQQAAPNVAADTRAACQLETATRAQQIAGWVAGEAAAAVAGLAGADTALLRLMAASEQSRRAGAALADSQGAAFAGGLSGALADAVLPARSGAADGD